jgi:predicted 3-demethylubiquinone-9 3-methyltransferase (glyoxalase superfamily)
MQKIVPSLWFDHNAKEAADFYISIFADSKINTLSHYPKNEKEGLADFQKDLAGKILTVDFELSGYHFLAINADATFKPNPSISFFYSCASKEEANELWKKLSTDGKTLMELGEYPFSKYYGWIQDKYGFSWQLMLNNPTDNKRPKIIPSLLFTKEQDGQAKEAIKFYTSVFTDSEIGSNINNEGKTSYADFRLFNQWFAVMDGGPQHEFSFNPAISLIVNCKDQKEIDCYWEKLSANPEFEQCGWLQDKYDISWQITPANMEELMKTPGAFKRMMQMKKIDIAKLQKSSF